MNINPEDLAWELYPKTPSCGRLEIALDIVEYYTVKRIDSVLSPGGIDLLYEVKNLQWAFKEILAEIDGPPKHCDLTIDSITHEWMFHKPYTTKNLLTTYADFAIHSGMDEYGEKRRIEFLQQEIENQVNRYEASPTSMKKKLIKFANGISNKWIGIVTFISDMYEYCVGDKESREYKLALRSLPKHYIQHSYPSRHYIEL